MSAERGRRWLAVLAVGGGALLASSSPLWGTYLGRQLAWLEVERVEVTGASLLAPEEIVRASGIRRGHNLLDEREIWEAALEAHPVVHSASVARRPPGTLRIQVVEKRPVAFVAGETLLPATADGELLPLDPASVALDLPIVHADADASDPSGLRRLLSEIERLSVIDPELMESVSQLRMIEEEGDLILLSAPSADVLLPFGADPVRTAQLRAVLADVERRASETEDRTRPLIDLRYGDQVVVGPPSSLGLS